MVLRNSCRLNFVLRMSVNNEKFTLPADLTLISSYLDDRLSPADKAKVEARLNEEALFRTSLEEMRSTRQMLRSLPQRRAPRNFTLSPEMLPRQHGLRLQPVFGWSSLAAAALTVVIFVGTQWQPGAFSASRQAATMQAAAPEMQSAATDAARNAASATAIPPLIIWNGQSYDAGGSNVLGMGGGARAPVMHLSPSLRKNPRSPPRVLSPPAPMILSSALPPLTSRGRNSPPRGNLLHHLPSPPPHLTFPAFWKLCLAP